MSASSPETETVASAGAHADNENDLGGRRPLGAGRTHPSHPVGLSTDALLDLLPVGVYCCDATGQITAFNRRAAELWGREPALGDQHERFCRSFTLFLPDGTPVEPGRTPMAEALRTYAPVRDAEAIVERADGSRVWVSINIDPLFDEDGRPAGAVNCFQDITSRKEAESSLRQNEAFLSTVFDTTPECVKIVAADGALLQMNRAGLRMIEADDFSAVDHARVFGLIAPEHRAQWQENHARVCDGESLTWEFDIIGLRGTRRHMETHAVPLPLPDGEVAQLAITRDVSERHSAGERQELLINEINHRVKNTLAMVQSMASLTMRASTTMPQFCHSFEERVGALCRAHDLLNDNFWQSLSLRAVLEAGLARAPAGERIALVGEDVELTPRQGIALTLIVHELATNAVRHGALSMPEGRLDVAWKLLGEPGAAPVLSLEWRESGGPQVGTPARKGFGAALIERGVETDMRGHIEQDFNRAGYNCTIRIPLGG